MVVMKKEKRGNDTGLTETIVGMIGEFMWHNKNMHVALYKQKCTFEKSPKKDKTEKKKREEDNEIVSAKVKHKLRFAGTSKYKKRSKNEESYRVKV